MRIMGIDLGSRRIGIALSDATEIMASPSSTIHLDGTDDGIAKIMSLAREESVEAYVVGLPLSLSGEDTEQTQISRDFADQLASMSGLTVQLVDERLSSRAANSVIKQVGAAKGGRSGSGETDRVAAAIILQTFLDTKRAGC